MEKYQITNEQLDNLIDFVIENPDLLEEKKEQLIEKFEKMKELNETDTLYSKDLVENWRIQKGKIIKEWFNGLDVQKKETIQKNKNR